MKKHPLRFNCWPRIKLQQKLTPYQQTQHLQYQTFKITGWIGWSDWESCGAGQELYWGGKEASLSSFRVCGKSEKGQIRTYTYTYSFLTITLQRLYIWWITTISSLNYKYKILKVVVMKCIDLIPKTRLCIV